MPLIKLTVLYGCYPSGGDTMSATEGLTWYFDSPLEAAAAASAATGAGFGYELDTTDFISDSYEFKEWLKHIKPNPNNPNPARDVNGLTARERLRLLCDAPTEDQT